MNESHSDASLFSLTELLARKADLERDYAEHETWLRDFASRFSSSEEQQRLVADLHDLDVQLQRLTAAIESARRQPSDPL